MNSLRNKVLLFGNVGNDPEIRSLENGRKMAKFSLATTEKYKNSDGEPVKDTQWHNLVAWGPQAGIVERFVVKGREVGIEGKIVTRSYEDREGVKRNITEIVVNDILLLGGSREK